MASVRKATGTPIAVLRVSPLRSPSRRTAEGVAEDFELRSIIGLADRDDVEATDRPAVSPALKVELSRSEYPALLLERDGVGRAAERGPAPSLDLDEAEDAVLLRDEVDLAGLPAEVSLEDGVASRGKRLLRCPLPVVAGASESSRPFREPPQLRRDPPGPRERHHVSNPSS